MQKRIKTDIFYKLYLNITSSIALIPAVILVVLFCLSVFTLNVDQGIPGLIIPEAATFKDVVSPDSARSLLSSIASGMITLMVFSFTMVMVVLNQTASNYSPRVLSTLIRGRFHQVIMGTYLGTIAYTFMVLSCIESGVYKFDVPVLSTIVTAFLSLVCLVLFIIFIQSISRDIQIGNIINKVYKDTLKGISLEKEKKKHLCEDEMPDVNQWEIVKSSVSGYLDSINDQFLIGKLEKMDITMKMVVAVGRFVNQRDVFFYISRKFKDKEQEEIFRAFVFRHQEIVQQNYIYGFKQLTEIAVKALSPGINDPGTAIQAIDRLTDLFVNRMELSGFPVLADQKKKVRFIYQPISLEDTFYFCFSSIKNYAGNDVTIMLKLLLMIKTLAQNDQDKKLTSILIASVDDAIEQFVPEIKSKSDKNRLLHSLEELNMQFPDHALRHETIKKLASL